jgi:hypothetical protein
MERQLATNARPSLRQADWRYLLPVALDRPISTLLLVGADPGLPEYLAEHGVATRISTSPSTTDSFDAVVALRGADYSLTELARRLAPEGVFYAELERRPERELRSGLGRIRRELKQAGLRGVQFYWVWPNHARRRAFLPLGVRGVIPWFLNSLFAGRSTWGKLKGLGLRQAAAFGAPLLARMLPHVAVTAVGKNTVSSTSAVVSLMAREIPAARAATISAVVTNSSDELGRVVVIPFGDDGPLVVAKMARLKTRNWIAENEAEGLARLQSLVPSDISPDIPKPLRLLRAGGVSISVESFLGGRVLAAFGDGRYRRSRWPSEYKLAADWLRVFHSRCPASREVWTEKDFARWVGQPLARYAEATNATRFEEELIARAIALGRSCIGRPIPIVWQHYAFGPWNVCRRGTTVGVFDWEEVTPGLPLLDLLYFSLRCYEQIRRTTIDRPTAVLDLFCRRFERNSFADLVDRVVGDYLASLEIDRSILPVALIVLLTMHATSRMDRTEMLIGERNRDNVYVACMRAVAENPGKLFDSLGGAA